MKNKGNRTRKKKTNTDEFIDREVNESFRRALIIYSLSAFTGVLLAIILNQVYYGFIPAILGVLANHIWDRLDGIDTDIAPTKKELKEGFSFNKDRRKERDIITTIIASITIGLLIYNLFKALIGI